MNIHACLPNGEVVRRVLAMNAGTTRAEYQRNRRDLRRLYHEVHTQGQRHDATACYSVERLAHVRSNRNAAICHHLMRARERRIAAGHFSGALREEMIELGHIAINCARVFTACHSPLP